MTQTEWEAMIEATLRSLPDSIRARIGNVRIAVAEVPSPQQKSRMGGCDDCGLLGLYEGVPLPERWEGREPMFPDRITLFTRAHQLQFSNPAALNQGARDTLVHELGHFLGLDDEELAELGL